MWKLQKNVSKIIGNLNDIKNHSEQIRNIYGLFAVVFVFYSAARSAAKWVRIEFAAEVGM